MKRLRRIILINWYLLDSVEIEIEGNTALVGPNASGKSSILDAVQAILLGADQRLVKLNASAGERNRRHLREYCLGIVRDNATGEELDPDLRPRESAVSYTVLCFHDDESGDEIAVGLAMHAQLAGAIFEVDGRFIAPRISLLRRDFLESNGKGEAPLPWERVREELRRRCRHQGAEFRHFSEAERFIKEMGEALGYQGRSFEPKRFARNLQNAVTFAPIRDVSQFVRRYILEDRPIRVKELQDSLRRYRDIEAKTKEVHARIEALKVIRAHYHEAARRLNRAIQYEWIEKEAAVLHWDRKQERLENERKARTAEQTDISRQVEQAKDKGRLATQEQARLLALIENDQTEVKRKAIESELGRLETQISTATEKIDAARRNVADLWQLLDKESIPDALKSAMKALGSLLPTDEELLVQEWPRDPDLVRRQTSDLAAQIESENPKLTEALDKRKRDFKILEKRLQDIRSDLEQLEEGKAPLGANPSKLQLLLRQRGIESQPLCDLIDVNDERWRDAIERYLGGQREALIVKPEDAVDAVRIYRREARDAKGEPLYGARVVNSRKTGEWLKRCDKGSLAEIVTTDDPHARAYLNRLLGRVIRVDTEDELLANERAVTDDGMLAANGSIERMQPVLPMIGKQAVELRKRALQDEFKEKAPSYYSEQTGIASDATMLLELDRYAQKLKAIPDLTVVVEQREQAVTSAKDQREKLAKLDTRDVDVLKEQAETAKKSIDNYAGEEKKLNDRAIEIGTALGTLNSQLSTANANLESAAQQRLQRTQAPGLDIAKAAEKFEKLAEEMHSNFAEVEHQALKRASSSRKDRDKNLAEAQHLVNEYAHRYSALLPGATGLGTEAMHLELEAWTLATLNSLEETELAGLVQNAERARGEAERIFHSKFVGLLRDNLAGIDDRLAELNRNLKKRPFHGEFYQFKKDADPDFAPIVRWVESATAEEQANVGGLFDVNATMDGEHFEARRKIRELLLGEVEKAGQLEEHLSDYRNYFRFDVEMRDAQGHNRATLSQRLGKGSGGEHQAPFYVAIGAALSATYRIERGDDGSFRGGMALAIFDEAFSKLDVQNTQNALAFLRDLGMQVLLAAPNEKYAILAEEMDTIVSVYRDGGAVSVEPEYIRPAARQLLARDNPFKQGSHG
jgi:uncharacterized protein YPO0396